MSTVQQISTTLKRMSELARLGNASNISASLERAAELVEQNVREGASTIVGMYGGMGSLNDVILYESNRTLLAENEEFDALRSKLFDLCQDLHN